MTAPAEKVVLNFAWEGPVWIGPTTWKEGRVAGVVDLLFKGAKTKISVDVPKNLSPFQVTKLPFTCRKDSESESPVLNVTHPDSLKVTIQQIRELTIKVGIFNVNDDRSDSEIQLNVPEKLEINQTYMLVVTSNSLSLSAHLLKEEKAKVKDERKDNFKNNLRKMGEALIAEGMKNLSLASQGGPGPFTSSSTTADVFVHGMQGVIRSGQHMNPEIRVPDIKPSKDTSELDKMIAEQLQARFDEVSIKDKEFETQRMKAAIAGNIQEMNQIMKAELENSQRLMNLAEALERKGVKAKVTQSASMKSALNQISKAQAEALKVILSGFRN